MKHLEVDSIEVDGIDSRDFPDFCDAYAIAATWSDGTELTEEELDDIDRDIIYDIVLKTFY